MVKNGGPETLSIYCCKTLNTVSWMIKTTKTIPKGNHKRQVVGVVEVTSKPPGKFDRRAAGKLLALQCLKVDEVFELFIATDEMKEVTIRLQSIIITGQIHFRIYL